MAKIAQPSSFMPYLKKRLIPALLVCFLLNSGCTNHRQGFPLPDKLPPAPPLTDIKVALVLGGGGARALAHAGVLEVLEQQHIPIDLIVGSSAGSIIGALYSDDPNARHLKKKIIALNKWDLLELNWFSSVKMLWHLTGPVEGSALKCFIKSKIFATDFAQLKIPLAVVTTDINRGETFVIRSGPVAPALHASSAIPMLFTPVNLYGKVLVDGGIASPVPVEVAKTFSPKVIIAVDIGTSPDYGPVNNVYQLASRSLHISYFKLSNWQTMQADIVIHPAVDSFSMFEDNANERIYQAGKDAAIEALPQIRQALEKHSSI